MKNSVGRPKAKIPRNKVFSVKLTEEELEEVRNILKCKGTNKTEAFLNLMRVD